MCYKYAFQVCTFVLDFICSHNKACLITRLRFIIERWLSREQQYPTTTTMTITMSRRVAFDIVSAVACPAYVEYFFKYVTNSLLESVVSGCKSTAKKQYKNATAFKFC